MSVDNDNNSDQINIELIEDVKPDSIFISNTPIEITQKLLAEARELLPAELPHLGSTIFEDFIVEKVKMGLGSDEILEAFENEKVEQRATEYLDKLTRIDQDLDWEAVFSELDMDTTREGVIREMERMDIDGKTCNEIRALRLAIGETFGSSISGDKNHTVIVSRLQNLRKALDYQKIFPDMDLLFLLKILQTSTLAHELGHKINDFSGSASERISDEWKADNGYPDNKSERFAEYWGRLSVCDIPDAEIIRQNEWLIQVVKISTVWNTIAEHNNKCIDADKIDPIALLRGFRDKMTSKNLQDFILSRTELYSGHEVENYAMPYTREIIEQSLKP